MSTENKVPMKHDIKEVVNIVNALTNQVNALTTQVSELSQRVDRSIAKGEPPTRENELMRRTRELFSKECKWTYGLIWKDAAPLLARISDDDVKKLARYLNGIYADLQRFRNSQEEGAPVVLVYARSHPVFEFLLNEQFQGKDDDDDVLSLSDFINICYEEFGAVFNNRLGQFVVYDEAHIISTAF